MYQLQSRPKVYVGDTPHPWNLDGEARTLTKFLKQCWKDEQASAPGMGREVRMVNTKTQPRRAMVWGGDGTLPTTWSQPRE